MKKPGSTIATSTTRNPKGVAQQGKAHTADRDDDEEPTDRELKPRDPHGQFYNPLTETGNVQ